MLFNSMHFLFFFPLVIILYFSIAHKYRWILLLIASYYFYMSWNPEYIILIVISTLVDYFAALKMGATKNKTLRKSLLGLSLIVNLGLLFSFKYFNFLNDSVRQFFAYYGLQYTVPEFNVLLPVAISFYTFQTLSYTIDVYRGKMQPERHLGIFAVYVSFFPQLVAGPIERAKNLLPQFFEKHPFSYGLATSGLKLMLWGFFKKLVIADRLAIMVNAVYGAPSEYSSIFLIMATIFFAFQIYCDFSGYSDIAIGAAQIMGFRLMDNFRRPYFAQSIADFWRRWHISLSTWFRDYVYIPLGGSKVKVSRFYLNILIVFVVSGIWHGANWTFMVWGALHGMYMIVGHRTLAFRQWFVDKTKLSLFPKVLVLWRLAVTFTLVNIAWIFFRANTVSDGFYILTNLFSDLRIQLAGVSLGGFGWNDLVISLGAIAFMEFVHLIQEHDKMRSFMWDQPLILRWFVYLVLIISILLFGVFENVQFIYFQF